MLKITARDHAEIRRHGEETYPHECCGVLLGCVNDGGTRVVTSTARCRNTRTDSLQNRYNIDPRELVRIQREGRERGEGQLPRNPRRQSPASTSERWRPNPCLLCSF